MDVVTCDFSHFGAELPSAVCPNDLTPSLHLHGMHILLHPPLYRGETY
jgi:hypothetical protein